MHAALHVVARVDATDEARWRQGQLFGNVFPARTGQWIGDHHPGVVHRRVLGVEQPPVGARRAGRELGRGVKHGNTVGTPALGVGDQRARDRLRVVGAGHAVGRAAGRSDDGHILQRRNFGKRQRVVAPRRLTAIAAASERPSPLKLPRRIGHGAGQQAGAQIRGQHVAADADGEQVLQLVAAPGRPRCQNMADPARMGTGQPQILVGMAVAITIGGRDLQSDDVRLVGRQGGHHARRAAQVGGRSPGGVLHLDVVRGRAGGNGAQHAALRAVGHHGFGGWRRHLTHQDPSVATGAG